jgi:hypothetical protein
MIHNNLEDFNSITSYGRMEFIAPGVVAIKFRFTIDKARDIYKTFINEFPDLKLKYYVTKNKTHVLLGGHFHHAIADSLTKIVQRSRKNPV